MSACMCLQTHQQHTLISKNIQEYSYVRVTSYSWSGFELVSLYAKVIVDYQHTAVCELSLAIYSINSDHNLQKYRCYIQHDEQK